MEKTTEKRKGLLHQLACGMRDGLPIGLGYFAVAFSLGIAAKSAGLTAFQGFVASLLNNASAGEYAGFTTIKANAPYLEIILITLVANARYVLMSCALSQKFSPKTAFFHRIFIGFDLTDELFGITIARPGCVIPSYFYGAMVPALAGWSVGTALGIMAGTALPSRIVSSLGVALFGMFIAIVIPQAKKEFAVALTVAASFISSYVLSVLPLTSRISEGTRTIILTIIISALAAIIFPVDKDGEEEEKR